MPLSATLLCFVLFLSGISAAHAQAGDATHASAARALFAEGVTAADAEDWETACDRFSRAHALRASPTIALNLAIALGHRGRVVEAVELLRGVARDPGASGELRASATQTLTELEPQIGWIHLTVEGPLESVTFAMDERPLARELLGSWVPFDPGAHRITATRDGGEIAALEATVAAGTRRELALVVPERPLPVDEPLPEPVDEPLPEPVDEPAPPLPVPSSGPDPLALGLGVGGGVLVLGGVLTLVLVLTLPSSATPFMGNAGIVEVGR